MPVCTVIPMAPQVWKAPAANRSVVTTWSRHSLFGSMSAPPSSSTSAKTANTTPPAHGARRSRGRAAAILDLDARSLVGSVPPRPARSAWCRRAAGLTAASADDEAWAIPATPAGRRRRRRRTARARGAHAKNSASQARCVDAPTCSQALSFSPSRFALENGRSREHFGNTRVKR